MDDANKQTQSDFEATEDKKQQKERCPDDSKCDHENVERLQESTHPQRTKRINEEDGENNIGECSTSKQMKYCRIEDGTKLTMQERLEATAPYNLFFNRISMSQETHKQLNCIEMKDLLCPSLGKLKSSLQINFVVDIEWLKKQYEAHNVDDKPLTVIYGVKPEKEKAHVMKHWSHVTHQYVNPKDRYGKHHSKIGIYLYEDGSLRVVVSTANLFDADWSDHNQGLWISQALPSLPKSSSDEEVNKTNFKTSLITYLKFYKEDCLKDWISHVEGADFSSVNVFLVCSMEGKISSNDNIGSHMFTMADLLEQYCELPEANEEAGSWEIIAQASSISSMGKNREWLLGEFLNALSKTNASTESSALNVVYPSKNNVNNSYYKEDKAGCLFYYEDTHKKQEWLEDNLRQWKADHTHRTRAIPHIKTYCRVSPCSNKLAWFLLTSANLSQGAWGGKIQTGDTRYVRSYEVGVLFLPKFFGENFFQIKGSSEGRIFPFMYDLPLLHYNTDDQPWFRRKDT